VIFVTVGAQMPFDRMVRAVDQWAADRDRNDIFAQIGPTQWRPNHISWAQFLDPQAFRQKVQEASVIVAHAGMGSILTALELGKPILVMPRRGDLKETRNDHQVATAKRFLEQGRVEVAFDEDELIKKLDQLDAIQSTEQISRYASPQLLEAVRGFIEGKAMNSAGESRGYDGVICFGGEDWWYHNRGHYDMQMMREISRQMPVLYVNSIGMRMPKMGEGRMFISRVKRKLKSFMRGLTVVRKGFGVYSPVSVPRFRHTWLGRKTLAWQVIRAAKRMGIRSPLVWVACPPAAEVIEGIPRVGLVYQRTDRFETFPGVDIEQITAYDYKLKAAADVTLFCSSHLYDAEREQCRRSAFVDHGVDYDRFSAAGDDGLEPEDVRSIRRPRVGFIGGIDSHTFDPDLFVAVAQQLPDCSFVMVGACSLPSGWCVLPNVHFLGKKQYESVPAYMASCDVLIMPWNQNEWIRACNPVKLKEYLAVGRPIVSTPFDELKQYNGFIRVASNAEEFIESIRNATRDSADTDSMRRAVEKQTWEMKSKQVLEEIAKTNVQAN